MKNNLSLTWGIIAGFGTVLLLICFYLINKALLFDTFVYYGSLSVTIFCMWIVGNKLIPNAEINFPVLLRNIFLVFVISEVIYYCWYFYMVNYFDKSLLELQKQQMLSAYQGLKSKATDIKEVQQWTQMIQELEKNGLSEVGISSILLQMGRGIIGGFVLSYLLTYFIQKRK